MGRKKKKEEEVKLEETSKSSKELPQEKKEVISFDLFYSERQKSMDFAKPCHPDWYYLGASPDQYPKADVKLESPKEAYEKYLKESKK
jgi:hypothetical protein